MKRYLVVGGAAAALACAGLALVGASLASAATPSIQVTPTTGLLDGQLLTVTGSGYAPETEGGPVECNDAPGQPTVQEDGFPIGVSCDVPAFGASYPFNIPQVDGFSSTGTVSAAFVVHTGVVGPPVLGIDSAGHNAAADAALYPCPPTPAQQAAGDICQLTVGDSDGNNASVPLAFAAPITATPTVTAVPATGLSSGQTVDVTGSGFTPGSPWLAMECNVTPGEPSGDEVAPNLPVGCRQTSTSTSTPVLTTPTTITTPIPVSLGGGATGITVTDASGAMQTSVPIAEGNLGGTTQSAAYPCPPTAANKAAGGSCVVVVEDGAGHKASATLGITGVVPVPAIALSPSTGLIGGATTEITGTNYLPYQLAGALECNDDPNQPTVEYEGAAAVSVSCATPQLVETGPTGTFSLQYRVTQGVTGPPSSGTDSAGKPASVDAAAYPCPPTTAQQLAGDVCQIAVGDQAGDVARVPISFGTLPARTAPVVAMAGSPDGSGYWLTASDGGVFTFGDAAFHGSAGAMKLNAPIVGMAATHDGGGYWLVASDGGVFTFGDAGFHGSSGGLKLDAPIVGMAATADGGGYWLVASDGGVFTFGDASFYGSMGGKRLNAPIVGMAASPDGKGYWLVARDGGIFTFGDAAFHGSRGSLLLNQPIVGMAATADGGGYWLVAGDGGIFNFGDAPFEGSTGAKPPRQVIHGMATFGPGPGYWLVGSAGGVYSFGGAPYLGSFPTT
jgi:Neocarzinostatin family